MAGAFPNTSRRKSLITKYKNDSERLLTTPNRSDYCSDRKMPSVHKDYRGKTPFWIGAYIDEFGRRRKQSTKTEDKRKAKTIVEAWQRAADLARAGRLTE